MLVRRHLYIETVPWEIWLPQSQWTDPENDQQLIGPGKSNNEFTHPILSQSDQWLTICLQCAKTAWQIKRPANISNSAEHDPKFIVPGQYHIKFIITQQILS